MTEGTDVLSHEFTNKQTIGGGNNGSAGSIQMSGGHLRVDPNLPISFHFHTYSSQVPSTTAFVSGSNCLSFPVNSTNRRNSASFSSHEASNHMMVISGATNAGITRPGFTGYGRGRGSRSSGSSAGEGSNDKDVSNRHRELHKTLEKNRRAHLRDCFEQLKQQLPKSEYSDKKTSHINIIHCAIKYIQCLKRTELEFEHERERLERTKLRYMSQISQLRDDLIHDQRNIDVDIILKEAADKVLTNGDTLIVDGVKVGFDDEDHSDGDVIIDVETGHDYDDETTTTASECADDIRDGINSTSFNAVTNTSFLSQCHA
ncbi:max-binding protein MNT-like protein [Leptotrombidium deliense]|uniref:Max-binding protein MNT-like protein n=1 Tax=Leptotrombidium deliense TaxID=299467 RepID=A0A443SQP9_9ACAR|nr:max-binding protein MNT-like protein [Leptotrombidium deliense]